MIGRLVRSLFRDRTAATMVEYALIVSLVSFVIVGSLTVAGDSLIEIFGRVSGAIDETAD